MHILYLQQLLTLPGSPGTQRSWEMAQYWAEKGHTVSICCSSACLSDSFRSAHIHSFYSLVSHEGVDLHILDIPYSHFMSFRDRLRAFYRFYREAYKLMKHQKGIDIILAYSAPLSSGFLAQKLSQKLNLPFIFELADVWPDVPIGMGIIRNPILISLLNWQTQKVYKAASGICTFTEDMKEQLMSHALSSSEVEVIHNGVNLAQFEVQERESAGVKVVYSGSLGLANGLSQLLYAWKLIEKKWSEKVSLHIMGEGNEEEKLRSLADDLGLKALHFHAPISQQKIADFLAGADIGLVSVAPFPVLEANGSTKAFEYMAAGLPIVLNYEGWLASYLEEYTCGLSSPMGYVEDFARNINRLISDKDLRREMGRNARKLAEEKFDRKQLAQRMLEIFEDSLSFI
ncbi:MAG: glycosyltransferase family 4 protein [Bacteroidota bacterium]